MGGADGQEIYTSNFPPSKVTLSHAPLDDPLQLNTRDYSSTFHVGRESTGA